MMLLVKAKLMQYDIYLWDLFSSQIYNISNSLVNEGNDTYRKTYSHYEWTFTTASQMQILADNNTIASRGLTPLEEVSSAQQGMVLGKYILQGGPKKTGPFFKRKWLSFWVR